MPFNSSVGGPSFTRVSENGSKFRFETKRLWITNKTVHSNISGLSQTESFLGHLRAFPCSFSPNLSRLQLTERSFDHHPAECVGVSHLLQLFLGNFPLFI